MNVLLTWTDAATGVVTEPPSVITIRRWKEDNANEPAAWYIEQQIREHGSYGGSTFGGVAYRLTRAPRK